MKKIIFVMLAFLFMTNEAMAFVAFGHETIAALADKHLTEKTKGEVKAILGTDMYKACSWLNTLRKQKGLEHSKDWHFFVLDENGKCTTTNENDGIVQLEKAVAVLRNRANEADSLVQASLKSVIHLVGDMHCLSHVRIDGIEETKGFRFYHWNEQEGKHRRDWNSQWYSHWEKGYLGRYYIFSPQYYGDDIDIYANKKKAEYEKGTPRFWVENMGEDVVRTLEVYKVEEIVPTQTIQTYEFLHTKCMAKASYRLAALLNDIFK